jgi:hypothetical protein
VIQEGLLWFDDDPKRSVSDKIERAAARYLKKYGRSPDVCMVHPAHLTKAVYIDGISVLPAKNVLPYHFWLGVSPAK